VTPTRTRRAARGPAAIAVLSTAQFLIALDYSIVYVALPDIAEGLRLTGAASQWIVSAYATVFAGFLILGGRLTDRLGGRRVFLAAVALFGAASAVGGAAPGGTALVAARAVQGLGAALLQPAVLGLIGATFPAGRERVRALSVWGSVGAAGLVAGVVLGAALTAVSWRLVLWVNVPLALACALGAAARFAPPRAGGAGTGARGIGGGRAAVAGGGAGTRIPVRATVLSTGAVVGTAAGLTFGAAWGWRGWGAYASLGGGLVLGAAFVRHERAAAAVLVDRALRRAASLRAGAVATALYMASVGSEFYLLTLLLQSARGYSPLRAGLAFVPAALLVTAGSTAAGRLMRRRPPAPVLAGGFAVSAAGLLWLALTAADPAYATGLLPGLLLSGFGHGVVYAAMFALGTRDAPPALHGTAGALLTTSQYVSGTLMVAVLTAVLGHAPTLAAYRTAFLLTAAAALAGAAAACRFRPERRRGDPCR
jgi:MFS family permease